MLHGPWRMGAWRRSSLADDGEERSTNNRIAAWRGREAPTTASAHGGEAPQRMWHHNKEAPHADVVHSPSSSELALPPLLQKLFDSLSHGGEAVRMCLHVATKRCLSSSSSWFLVHELVGLELGERRLYCRTRDASYL
jgi:hypothetical protein